MFTFYFIILPTPPPLALICDIIKITKKIINKIFMLTTLDVEFNLRLKRLRGKRLKNKHDKKPVKVQKMEMR